MPESACTVPGVSSVGRPLRPLGAPGLVASAWVAHDLPDSSEAERDAAARHVDASVAEMPDAMRLGVRVAGAAAYAVLSCLAGRRFGRLDAQRRAELAARLGGSPLPVVSEFGRLTRGLALAHVYEARHAGGRV